MKTDDIGCVRQRVYLPFYYGSDPSIVWILPVNSGRLPPYFNVATVMDINGDLPVPALGLDPLGVGREEVPQRRSINVKANDIRSSMGATLGSRGMVSSLAAKKIAQGIGKQMEFPSFIRAAVRLGPFKGALRATVLIQKPPGWAEESA